MLSSITPDKTLADSIKIPTTYLFLALFAIASYAQSDQNTPNATVDAEEIVSEKDKVKLVDDANLDEAIKRRPDLDFNNVSIDQENSNISLSTIPAQAVKKAEVLKAATPDLDADTRGGILKVKFRPAYELQNRVIKGRVYTRYKWIYDSFGRLADVTWANRVGENAGIRITAEGQDIVRGSDTFRVDWSDNPSNSINQHFIERIGLINSKRKYDTYRINGSFDYRLSPQTDLFFRISYDSEQIDAIGSATQVRYGQDSNFDSLSRDSATTSNGSIRREGRHWDMKHESITYTLGGNHNQTGLEIDWRVQHNIHTDSGPTTEIVRFDRNNASLAYRNATTAFPVIEFPNPDSSDSYELSSYDRKSEDTDETSTIFALDTQWHSVFSEQHSFFKFGIKASNNSSKISNVTDVFATQSATPIMLTGFVSGFRRENFIDRSFSPGITADAEAVGIFLNANPGLLMRDDLLSALRTDPANYEAEEDIAGAYAMINWERGRLRLLGGVRFERTELSSVGNEVIDNGTNFIVNQRTAANDYSNYFPGIHARYRWSDKLDIIGSFTKTIKRPNFRDTAPFRIISTDDREIVEGNPALEPTLFNNWDLAFDYKANSNFMLSWEWFYRDISDSLFRNTSTVNSGPFAGFILEQLRNGESSTHYGSKIVYQQKLVAFAPVLEPLSWNIAYTANRSSAEYSQRPGDDLPLVDKPKHKIEAVFSFDKAPFFAQLIFDYRSDMLIRVNSKGAEKDIFASEFFWINFKGEYAFNEKLTFFIDWKNLTKEYEAEQHESAVARPHEYKHDPWQILTGIRFKL